MKMRKLRWLGCVLISFGLAGFIGLLLSISKPPSKVIDQGIANMIDNVMPTVVHIWYEGSGYGNVWQGSGVIISEDGLILTAKHVIKSPGVFTVSLSDGREFVTEKACVSRRYDVGYLKIDVNDPLPAATFGDSSLMRLGSRLLTIGSPWGKQHFNSVTLGILSACNRDYGNYPYGWEVIFQTDVAVNPGNSGGPVFNIDGEVVGIVVGLYGPGTYVGITYCVPSNICKSIIRSSWLAFALQEVTLVEAPEPEPVEEVYEYYKVP